MDNRCDMSENQPDSPNQTGSKRNMWLLGGALALLAIVTVCFVVLAATIGAVVVQRIAANPPASVQVTTEPPARPLSADEAASSTGRIAVITPDGGLVTVAPDGSDVRGLGLPGVRYQFPAWSGDSSRLAVIANDGTQAAIQVVNDNVTPDAIELYGSGINPPFYLYWSPDDGQVSFLANDRSGIALWLAQSDGAQPAGRVAGGQPFYWDWTADSQQLLVHVGGLGAESHLGFIDIDGNAVGDDLATPGLFQTPGIAAGGRYVAFSQAAGEQFEVAIQDTTSGAQSTVRQFGLAAMSWSPAGDQLAFISPSRQQMTFAGPLQVIDAATGETRTLVNDPVGAFFWSPDGKWIATLTQNSGRNSPDAGAAPEFAAAGRAASQQAAEIVLDLSVVDVASGQTQTLASFRPSDVFLNQFLPYFDQYALSHRLWSPASDALVLPIVDDRGRAGIYVVSLEDGAPARVADGVMGVWSQ